MRSDSFKVALVALDGSSVPAWVEERFARDGIAFMARECHGRDELRGPRRCPSPMSKATSGTTLLESGTPRTGRARP